MADTYGALRSDARILISRLVSRGYQRFSPLSEAEVGKAAWCGVSSAAISRAASQLGRLTIADNPLGMKISALNLATCRMKAPILPVSRCQSSTGIVQPLPPSSARDANKDIFDFSVQAEEGMAVDAAMNPRITTAQTET